MSTRWQNTFFFLGMAVLIVMVTQLDFAQTWLGLKRAGYWAVAVILLWAFLYILNTAAMWLIIGRENRQRGRIGFLWLYKIMVSGFALNYATPGGLLGGEPYKIMMLRPKIGTEQATSAVILHTMTHMYSHFWFWLLACALYVLTQPITLIMCILLPLVVAFCLLVIWFFMRGYKRGVTVWLMHVVQHFPLIRHWAQPFMEKHAEQLVTIDRQIAALKGQNRKTFMTALMLELGCRIASAAEIMFILLVVMPSANFLQCILILAFTSLVANMLFFIPLQLGGREGGFLMSINGLGMSASAAIFVALIVRIRELVWTGIGLLLIKIDKKTQAEKQISA